MVDRRDVALPGRYGTLYKWIPTLRLAAGLGQIPFKDDAIIYGVRELPVTW